MRSTIPLAVGLIAALFSGNLRAKAETPEQRFWQWFQSNETSLFDFEKDKERTFDRLAEAMHKVNPELTFEFGPKRDGRRDFVISADGIKKAFPAVEALYATAPSLPRWNVIKFRPRRSPNDISMGNLTVKASSVRVGIERNGGKVDLTLFVPGYSEDARSAFLPIVYLILDEALGEYDVETYVGFIDIHPTAEEAQNTYSIVDLPKVFDLAKAKIVQ